MVIADDHSDLRHCDVVTIFNGQRLSWGYMADRKLAAGLII
jgi:hypothetical protein